MIDSVVTFSLRRHLFFTVVGTEEDAEHLRVCRLSRRILSTLIAVRVECWAELRNESTIGLSSSSSSQEVDDQKTKQEEYNHPSPEDPFILHGSSLDHSDGVAAYA